MANSLAGLNRYDEAIYNYKKALEFKTRLCRRNW